MIKQPTLEEVRKAMPSRFRETTAWSTEDGEDCLAIRGSHHVLYFEKTHVLCWVIQGYVTFDDPTVGIFGQEEPDDVAFSCDDVYAAMKQFIVLEADLEADDFTSNFAEWLQSAERAEESKA